ncbi:MAG: hypothetical protein COA79_21775 [Planctomycetota bacterium]|nr:MAG: hypothetical protein COA79_21775 [Planctomycetota bacterium]
MNKTKLLCWWLALIWLLIAFVWSIKVGETINKAQEDKIIQLSIAIHQNKEAFDKITIGKYESSQYPKQISVGHALVNRFFTISIAILFFIILFLLATIATMIKNRKAIQELKSPNEKTS